MTKDLHTLFTELPYGPNPENADAAHAWLAQHNHTFGQYIGGVFTDPGDELLVVHNPADGSELAKITSGREADVNSAVKAARKALPAWQKLSGQERAQYLYAIARQLQKHSRLFAVLESLNNGKPIRESRDIDIPLAARHFYHHAGWAMLQEEALPGEEPQGVCGQIIPWNFPMLMLAWKIAPALATGNTVVLKPAEYTPLTALLFAELVHAANIPAGVINIVTGAGKTGEHIVANPGIDKLAFTGSTKVGRIIREATADRDIDLTLELGGKSPFIVFDDADIDSAIEGVVDAIWFNQGQVCCAGSRLLVQENIAPTFERKLRERMETLREGNALDKSIDIGAIVAPVQLQRIEALVAQGIAEGATCHQPSWSVPKDGWYYPPTLLTNVSPSNVVAQEEIFGPVIVSLTFRTPAEAVALANNTRYGLAASVWSENVSLVLDVAPKIKAGVVWVNGTNIFDAAAGFGGYRESGYGREGGLEGLRGYTKQRLELPEYTNEHELPEAAPVSFGTEASGLDVTRKLYIGGKQVRPDGGYTYQVTGSGGAVLGDAPLGNRKDIRNAVEAAAGTSTWAGMTGHARAQVLYYLAENLQQFAGEFTELLGKSQHAQPDELNASVARLMYYAAWADKFDGRVHSTITRHITIAMNEPLGVMGLIAPPDYPLLGAVSLLAPVLATGNTAVLVPSTPSPLPALKLVQVLETSDVPAGTVNIVTGMQHELALTLADHHEVAGIWQFTDGATSAEINRRSAGNFKHTWVNHNQRRNWLDNAHGQGEQFLRRASQVKNIWVPYGV